MGKGSDAGPIKYHLQHWCIAKPNDDPEGILYDRGSYVQCGGDCDTPQVCTSCVTSCHWWESSGIADMSSGVWVGRLCQVNFVGDVIATWEFVCVDQVEAGLELLWQGLPDVADDAPRPLVVPTPGPSLTTPTAMLCLGSDTGDPAWSILQAPSSLMTGVDSLTVYSDGSLQGSGSVACCGGAGIAVLDEDKSLWEVGVHVGGWLSSTKTEVYACIMALATLPQHFPLQIFIDSQSLISGFHSYVVQVHLQPFCYLLWTRFYWE